MCDCFNCVFRGRYSDMGVSEDVCTLCTDLNKAINRVEVHKTNCDDFISRSRLLSYVRNNGSSAIALIIGD